MDCKEKTFSFFLQAFDPTKPILLGLSGGADSMALLHLLLEYRKKQPLQLHLVHIDHGWRTESAHECEILKKKAQDLKLPFHTKRCDPRKYTGNLEAESRNERLQFFEALALELSAQGILLAHHAGDQAETVFKRILEGGDYSQLRSILPVTKINSLAVLRPLLSWTKGQILSYLQEQNISYFDDPTNDDETFLRAKMRKTIFPFLKKQFGKEFEGNLNYLAEDCQRLARYLDFQIAKYPKTKSPFGIMLDKLPTHPYELQHFLKGLLQENGGTLSREQRALVSELLISKMANKEVKSSSVHLFCDRGILFWLYEKVYELPASQKLQFGLQQFGPYSFDFAYAKESDERKNHWKDLFSGISCTIIPEGDYELCCYNPQKKSIKILRKFFNNKKIPNFLVARAPLIVQSGPGECVVEDFLTKRVTPSCNGKAIVVRLYLI